MKSKRFITALLSAAVLFLSACGAAESSEPTEIQEETIQVEAVNGVVEVPADPQRIVVFDMGVLDTIEELKMGDRVVGVPLDSLPDYLSRYDTEEVENIGTLKEPDFEAIYALEPDVIFISGRQQDFLESLSEIAPTVFQRIDNNDYWTTFEKQAKNVGSIFMKEQEVDDKLAELEVSIEDLQEKVEAANISTLTVLLNEGNLSAYGSGSRFGLLNDLFHFPSTDPSIEASTHGQSVSYEYVLNQNPDVLFVVDRTTAIGGDTSNNNLMNNPLIQETNAYQSDQIVNLNPEVWYLSGGGMQSMELMIEEAASVVD